jgi:hypothetical protein
LSRNWKNTTIWMGLAAIIGLFVPAILLVPRQPFFVAMDAVGIAAAAAICIGSAAATWAAVKLPFRNISLGQLLSVGFFVICLAIALVFGGLWAWRAQGKPDWIADWVMAAFSRWLLDAGLLAAVTVTFTTEGVVTINSYRRSLTLLAVALSIAALLIWLGLG